MNTIRNMYDELNALKSKMLKTKQELVSMATLGPDLTLRIDPEFEDEARKLMEPDKRYHEVLRALKRAEEEGRQICKRFDVPLARLDDPLRSLEGKIESHIRKSHGIEKTLERLHKFDPDTLKMKVRNEAEKQRLEGAHATHNKRVLEIRKEIKALADIYTAAGSALDSMREALAGSKDYKSVAEPGITFSGRSSKPTSIFPEVH